MSQSLKSSKTTPPKTAGRNAEPVQAVTSSRSVEEEMIARASMGMQSLPMLDVIFSRLPADIVSALSRRASVLSEGALESIQYASWTKFHDSFDPHSVFTIAEAHPWAGNIILAMDPAFFYSAIETQLNGTPEPGNIPKRHPSTIERRLARSLSENILTEIARNFARLTEVRFDIQGIENIQQISSQLGANAPCVMSVTEIRIGHCVGRISIVIPIATIEPIQPKLKKMFLGEKLGGDGTWRDHISSRITSSTVTVEAQLAEVSLPLQDILDWKPGSTFELGIDADHEVTIFCSGLPVLHGTAGRRSNNRSAIRITRDYGEKIANEVETE
ncbi:flagellar motor switch protein FliM [Paracoccus litorisediminis]|uniref:flagellar motor switch protein FliM n=1 Tax=Paracoccus litorisediminis TaxID=2006130 RepID=UPI00372F80B7